MKKNYSKLLIWSAVCIGNIVNYGKAENGFTFLKNQANIQNLKAIQSDKNNKEITYESYSISGIGMTIDSSESNYAKFKCKGVNIIDKSFLLSLTKNGNIHVLNHSEFYVYEASTMDELATELSINYTRSSSTELQNKYISGNLDTTLGIKNKTILNKKTSKYYKIVSCESNRYSYNLSLTNVNASGVREHLDSQYLASLEQAFETNQFDNLFNTYGTHLITSGTYGGSFYASLSAGTNKLNISDELGFSVGNSEKINVESSSDSSSWNLDIDSSFSYKLSEEEKEFNIWVNGGSTIKDFTTSTLENQDKLSSKYNSWAETVDSNVTLSTINNVIPLWDLLPTKYNTQSYISSFIDAYNCYYQKNASYYSYSDLVETPYYLGTSFDFNTYENPQKITDKGHYKYQVELDLPNSIGWCYKTLMECGYKSVIIGLEITMHEIDDGIQEFYLFQGFCNKYASSISYKEIDYIPEKGDIGYDSFIEEYAKLNTKGDTAKAEEDIQKNGYKYLAYNNRNINFGKFYLKDLKYLKENNKFIFAFGAHGYWDDDWEYNGLKVNLLFLKC